MTSIKLLFSSIPRQTRASFTSSLKIELMLQFTQRTFRSREVVEFIEEKQVLNISEKIKHKKSHYLLAMTLRLATSYSRRGKPPTTIGAEELNFRVRYGNGCDLFAIGTRLV